MVPARLLDTPTSNTFADSHRAALRPMRPPLVVVESFFSITTRSTSRSGGRPSSLTGNLGVRATWRVLETVERAWSQQVHAQEGPSG